MQGKESLVQPLPVLPLIVIKHVPTDAGKKISNCFSITRDVSYDVNVTCVFFMYIDLNCLVLFLYIFMCSLNVSGIIHKK